MEPLIPKGESHRHLVSLRGSATVPDQCPIKGDILDSPGPDFPVFPGNRAGNGHGPTLEGYRHFVEEEEGHYLKQLEKERSASR